MYTHNTTQHSQGSRSFTFGTVPSSRQRRLGFSRSFNFLLLGNPIIFNHSLVQRKLQKVGNFIKNLASINEEKEGKDAPLRENPGRVYRRCGWRWRWWRRGGTRGGRRLGRGWRCWAGRRWQPPGSAAGLEGGEGPVGGGEVPAARRVVERIFGGENGGGVGRDGGEGVRERRRRKWVLSSSSLPLQTKDGRVSSRIKKARQVKRFLNKKSQDY